MHVALLPVVKDGPADDSLIPNDSDSDGSGRKRHRFARIVPDLLRNPFCDLAIKTIDQRPNAHDFRQGNSAFSSSRICLTVFPSLATTRASSTTSTHLGFARMIYKVGVVLILSCKNR